MLLQDHRCNSPNSDKVHIGSKLCWVKHRTLTQESGVHVPRGTYCWLFKQSWRFFQFSFVVLLVLDNWTTWLGYTHIYTHTSCMWVFFMFFSPSCKAMTSQFGQLQLWCWSNIMRMWEQHRHGDIIWCPTSGCKKSIFLLYRSTKWQFLHSFVSF